MTPRRAAILVCRHDDPERVREALAAARAAGAAQAELWLPGADPAPYRALPADAILTLDDEGDPVPERYPAALAALRAERGCDLVLACAGVFANEVAVRLAWTVGAACATAVTGIECRPDGLVVRRREYGLQIEAEFLYDTPPWVFTVARDAFAPAAGEGAPAVIRHPDPLPGNPAWYRDYAETRAEAEDDLAAREVVLIGGRGLGGRAAADRLERLGAALAAGVGATRPVVLNAWLPMERMVGASGVAVRPRVCVAFGASGSVPFLKGIEKSGLVIAVNSDPNALIFRHCDVGVVADCNQAVEQLLRRAAERA